MLFRLCVAGARALFHPAGSSVARTLKPLIKRCEPGGSCSCCATAASPTLTSTSVLLMAAARDGNALVMCASMRSGSLAATMR